ncbi:MAG: hypothetical protein U0167_03135 [bacterium]
MSWSELLAKRRLHHHKTSRAELDALRALVGRDLRDAELAGLSHDRQFAIAYNAVFLLGKMVVACAGYRALAGAHHQTTFEGVLLAMGRGEADRVKYFFTNIGGQARNNIAALDAGTGLATSWDPNADSIVDALAVSGPAVFAGGAFLDVDGQPRSGIAAISWGVPISAPR